MRPVEKITCVNSAAFVMSFSIKWIDEDGDVHQSSWSSGNYPVGQERTSPPLNEVGVPANALGVAPVVNAVLGKNNDGEPMVAFYSNGQAATYRVHGTTLDFGVDLVE